MSERKSARAKQLPVKKDINLARKERKTKSFLTGFLGTLAILLIAGAVAKFGVIDQYARLGKAEAMYNTSHEQYVRMQNRLARYPELEKEYRSYSGNRAYSDGAVTADIGEVLDIVEKDIQPNGYVESIRLSGGEAVISMSNMNLEQIGAMLADVKENELVKDALLLDAASERVNDGAADFTLRITFNSESEEEK